MPERRRKYTPEFKDEAARMVVDTSRGIAEVARDNPRERGHARKLGSEVPTRPHRRGTTLVDHGGYRWPECAHPD
jgi:transposase-like protein